MEISGYFWLATILMAVMAFGFIGLPLLQNNRRIALLVVAVVIPVLAAGLYLQLGSPNAESESHASRPSATSMSEPENNGSNAPVGSVASMVDGLASRLQENPDDAGSWLLLARSYKHLNRIDAAIEAYRQAAALGEFDTELAELAADTSVENILRSQIYGNVRLAESATGLVQPTDTVYIFARAVGGPPMPVAVLSRPASELPIDFLLNDSQSMAEGIRLSNYDEVIVTARITRMGDATVALQGLEASTDAIRVADNQHLTLVIE